MQKNTLDKYPSNKSFISPSVLAADFTKLGQEVVDAENAGADFFHIDIMDGHFVPNLSMGASIVKAIRPLSCLPFDVHLMLSKPSNFVSQFHEAGADHITIHVESDDNIKSTIEQIRTLGCSVGLSLKPDTSEEALIPFLEQIDLILVMTVEPGFGGQRFRYDMVKKIEVIREFITKKNYQIHLEVDGGITPETGPIATAAGANVLVAGTSLFKSKNGLVSAISELRVNMNSSG